MALTAGIISTQEKSTLLLCHAGALGDFILTWPALRGLKYQYPRYHLTAIGRKPFLDLAVKYGLLDDGFDLESRQMMEFFQGTKIPAIPGRLAGAVLWLKNANNVLKLLTPVCSGPVLCIDPFPPTTIHLARYYCSELHRIFSIPYPENLTELLPDLDPHQQRDRYALIHPGSGSPSKNFTTGFYLQLRSLLQSYGFKKVYFVLGPAESTVRYDFFPETAVVRPQNPLELAEWLAKAMFFVGNDSGVSHLAGFLGIPTVVFYRSTDPDIWGVRGKKVWYIQAQAAAKAGRLFNTLLKKLKIILPG